MQLACRMRAAPPGRIFGRFTNSFTALLESCTAALEFVSPLRDWPVPLSWEKGSPLRSVDIRAGVVRGDLCEAPRQTGDVRLSAVRSVAFVLALLIGACGNEATSPAGPVGKPMDVRSKLEPIDTDMLPTNHGSPDAVDEQLIVRARWHDNGGSSTKLGDAATDWRSHFEARSTTGAACATTDP